MLGFLRRRAPLVSTTFRWFEPKVLQDVDAPGYAARRANGAYVLELKKPSFFAWEIARTGEPLGDFILEARMAIDPANGYSAAGFLLRYDNEENFYSFLVSNRGFFRFDLLFNNHPMPLIEWTPLPEQSGESPRADGMPVRVIARGSHFSFYEGDEWLGETEDETLTAGEVGFAAQNYAEAGRAAFRLSRLTVEGRPVEVEREHMRWVHYVPHAPAARLALAETLFASGSFGPAAIQLSRSLKGRTGTAREHFLMAECYLRLSLPDRALAEVEETLRLEPAHAQALFEKANLLYLSNRFLQTRDWVHACLQAGTLPASPALWNLVGNAEYALGNWEQSANAYLKAAEMQPDMPLFLRNAARSLERAGSPGEALRRYLEAARLFFREQAYDELSLLVPRVQALEPDNAEVRALEAKMLYHEGRREEALVLLQELSAAGSADSAVEYLLGIIMAEKGQREEALSRFHRAAQMEPAFPLYAFRVAETLHLLGRDAGEALSRALAIDPEEPWANNLAGVLALEAGDPAAAAAALGKAHDRAPAELEISMNLSEALARQGRTGEALALISGLPSGPESRARLANQRGNILSRAGDHGGAVRAFEEAVREDPESPVYKENCASACLAIDMVHRAEELLAQAEAKRPSAGGYKLFGDAAMLKGELARAEAAYRAGLGLEPANLDLKVSLAALQLERGRYKEAKAVVGEVLAAAPQHAPSLRLITRIRERHESPLSCAACGRQWWVPKALPPQPPLVVRGEPPAEAPAGRCGRCGKLYCISCATPHLRDQRFHCADCGEPLRLSDDSLRYLLNEIVERHGS
jgi:tetratricopeptide (TPR) repeat protein